MISLSLRQTSAASIFEHSAEPFLAAVSLPDGRAGRDCISPTILTTFRVHATRFAFSLFEPWRAQRVPRPHPNVSRRSAYPSVGVSGRRRQGSGGHGHLPAEASAKAGEAKMQNPGAKKRAAGTKECGLIELVRWECNPTIDYACRGCGAARSGAPLIRDRHGLERSTQVGFTRLAHIGRRSRVNPEIGVCRITGKNRNRTNQRGVRVFGSLILRRREAPSRRMRPASPSCFETHRSAVRLWKRLHSRCAAMLLSMRATVSCA